MATTICTIDATGIHRPLFQDCLNYFKTQFQQIYGSDIYVSSDSQDGQFLGLLATALDDINGQAVATYNAFSPSTAQGTGLSSVVKINGLRRNIPTFSIVLLQISGVVGTTITSGVVKDDNGNLWDLPPSVVIPPSGIAEVTAVCETIGAILTLAGTITSIQTPTPGWQAVINLSDSSQGAPVEEDGQLRQRQSVSAALPASGGAFVSLEAAIGAIPGLNRYKIYENNDPGADPVYGIPGNSIAVVVSGGDVQVITDTIAEKKGNGVRAAGSTTNFTTPDAAGISRKIAFSYEMDASVTFKLKIQALSGFTAAIQQSIQQSLSDWVNTLSPGTGIDLSDAYMYARLNGAANSKTYRIVADSLTIGKNGQAPTIQNVTMLYYEKPICFPNYVTVILTS